MMEVKLNYNTINTLKGYYFISVIMILVKVFRRETEKNKKLLKSTPVSNGN